MCVRFVGTVLESEICSERSKGKTLRKGHKIEPKEPNGDYWMRFES